MPSIFTGITDGGDLQATSQIGLNLQLWLDEAFLNAGMYRRLPASGEGDYANTVLTELQAVTDKRYPSGVYWESRTNNWVWESGLSISAGFTVPFRPSGVYLRTPGATTYTFYPSGTANGSYNYKINFKEGSVRFINNDIVPPESTLLCPHTYKEVHVDSADNDRYKQLVFSDTKEQVLGSGVQFPTNRQVQMPVVFIEHIDRRWRPLELGGHKIAVDAWQLHVFAENKVDRDQICDMLESLEPKTIKLVDFNAAPFPLDDNGEPNPAYPNLDTLQSTNFYKNLRFNSIESRKFQSTAGWYRGEVSCGIEITAFQ